MNAPDTRVQCGNGRSIDATPRAVDEVVAGGAPSGLFDGATEAIGEVGGFSVTFSDEVRAYLIETAEKGIMWLRLRAHGTPGHASMLQPDNAVANWPPQ